MLNINKINYIFIYVKEVIKLYSLLMANFKLE